MQNHRPLPEANNQYYADVRATEDTRRMIDDRVARIREQLNAQLQSGMYGPEGSLSRKKREEEIAQAEVRLKASYTELFDGMYALVDYAEEVRASRRT